MATKKKLAPRGDEEGQIMLAARESLIYRSMACLSRWNRLYRWQGNPREQLYDTVIQAVRW